MGKLRNAAQAAGPVVLYAALALGFLLAGYQVWRTTRHETPGKKITLDFLWPTYTPQKVRYGEYLAQRYMEENPDVYVNLILTPDPYRKLQVMIAGRTTPDVAWLGVGWQQFADALMPVDARVAADPAVRAEDYFPRLWQAIQWRGTTEALPSSGQVGVIYYNKDLFDEAGLAYPTADWTWDDMVRMARALTRDFDGDGTIDQYGLQLGQVYLAPFMLYDGQIADPQWRTARVDTPVTRAILERYQALMYEDKVMPTPTTSQELGMLPMFEAGRVAMHAASGYAIESFRKVQFDWDVVPFPWFEFEGRRYRATGLWEEEFAILRDTDVPEEAWRFARWCTGSDMVRWAALDGHIVPGRIDVASSDAYLHSQRRPENMQAFTDSLSFAVSVYPHPWLRRIAIDFEPVLDQYSIGTEGRRITAAQALTQLQQILQGILDEYNAEHGESPAK
ncbi:MAG: sugar ABC transporter substrate-binding protein [Candidatus Hydrogenedentes bacterium]|nr:sugar ABC transporter substrate-binding protein [Candidatus Hydrogenedentota bacterium]